VNRFERAELRGRALWAGWYHLSREAADALAWALRWMAEGHYTDAARSLRDAEDDAAKALELHAMWAAHKSRAVAARDRRWARGQS